MSGLTPSEIMKVVKGYIGVTGGYLNGFSYTTLAEFYPEYCDLDINPYEIEGTTRERFIEILKVSKPVDQAKILRGILDRYPATGEPATRTAELRQQIQEMISRIDGALPISSPSLQTNSEVVLRAIADVETLLIGNGAISGVDRIHTALHGYLMAVCNEENIAFASDANLNSLFKLLREDHPALNKTGHRGQDITQIIRAFCSIMDALNPVRNKASVAHPNDKLLDKDEAMLVINVTRTLLHYLDAKFQ